MKPFILALMITALAWAQNPETATFPSAVATDKQLFVASNGAITSLSMNMSAGQSTMYVVASNLFIAPTLVRVDSEVIAVCSVGMASMIACTVGTDGFNGRGMSGTTPASHTSGATVTGTVDRTYHNRLAAEVKAIEENINGMTINGATYGTVCDGTTDDAATIQAALDHANSVGGGNVLLANGTCKSTLTLTVYDNTTLIGANATVKFYGTSNGFSISGDNITLRNIGIDTTNTSGTLAINVPVGSDGFTADRIRVTGAAADATSNGLVDLFGERATITGSTFDGISLIYDSSAHSRVTGNTFLNYRTGVYAIDTSDVLIDSNRCVSVSGTGVVSGYNCALVENVAGVTVSNNMVYAAREHGFYFSGPNTNVSVVGNSIYDFDADRDSGVAGIKVQRQLAPLRLPSKVTIIGNTVTMHPTGAAVNTFGILLIGCTDCTVGANVVSQVNTGILVNYGTNVMISGNTANYCGGPGIRLQDVYGPIVGVTITGNHAFNNNQSTFGFAGLDINLDGGFINQSIIITNNQFGDTQTIATQDYGANVSALAGGSTVDAIYMANNYEHNLAGGLYTGVGVDPVYIFNQRVDGVIASATDPAFLGTFTINAKPGQGAVRVVDIQYPTATNDVEAFMLALRAGNDVTLGGIQLRGMAYPSATGTNRYVSLQVSDSLAPGAARELKLNPGGGAVSTGEGLSVGSGGSGTKIVCWKSDGKTLGYATMTAGDISACN